MASETASQTSDSTFPALRERLECLLGEPVQDLQPITGARGYTPALRLRAVLRSGTAFVKVAVTGLTAGWLRSEQHVYTHLHGDFLPRMLACDAGSIDGPDYPILVLEDLSQAFWPPPWTSRRIEQVRETLAQVAACSVPGLEPVEDAKGLTHQWQAVAEDPLPFLSLGLVTPAWLERALPVLLPVDERAALRGTALLHTDVRSDNLCFRAERAVLVDWNWTCLGNPQLDLAGWLPSLESEGGPPPDAILPDGAAFASMMSGYMASRAGLPIIPDAPHVRSVQRRQLGSVLPWAVRALDLPPLDGPVDMESFRKSAGWGKDS